MKSRITALFAGLMLSLAVHATSIDNPVAPLTGEVAQKLIGFDDQMAESMLKSVESNTSEDKTVNILGIAHAMDIPFKELGYSMDKTILAILKVQDTNQREGRRLQRWGFFDVTMGIFASLKEPNGGDILIEGGYLSPETVSYWNNR